MKLFIEAEEFDGHNDGVERWSCYYQALTDRRRTWFVNGVFRNEDNLCIERCLDKARSLFEFFVPAANERRFLDLAHHLMARGYLFSLEKKPNRFEIS